MKESLKKQLEKALEDKNYYREQSSAAYSRAQKAEEELKKIRQADMLGLSQRVEREVDHNRILLEIIRWLANPTTATDPFNEAGRLKNNPPRNF